MPQLLDHHCYSCVFALYSGQRVGYLRADGNIGDWLIDAATQQLCERFRIELVDVKSGEPMLDDLDAIFSAGAGNFGRYENEIAKRRWALATGLPVIVLPQTASGSAEWDQPFEAVWCRDVKSLRYHRQAALAPDLALAFDGPQYPSASRGVGLFLRRGWEETPEQHERDLGDPAGIAGTVEDYLQLAASYEHIITNRLHFAIAGLLQRRRVTLLPNSYHKNRSVWAASLWQFGCQWAHDAETAWRAATC